MSWATRFELRQYLKGSLWVLPLLGGLLGTRPRAGRARGRTSAVRLPSGWNYSPSTASGVLTAIVGAMVALIGFVVTIGVLVVQQATGTLSPRYMRLWYRDRLQKAVLATFAGTFTFAFSLLRRVEDDFVPDIGVTVAGTRRRRQHRAAADLPRPVHPQPAARRGRRARRTVGTGGARRLDPAVPRATASGALAIPAAETPVQVVRAARAGAVQAVDVRAVVAAADRYGSTIVLVRTVGDFVTRGTALVEVHGAALPAGGRHLRGLFALGRERTIEQDPAFALRILVDVAIKALSPAINDPTTAVQVLDHIEAFVEVVARHRAATTGTCCPGGTASRAWWCPGRGWAEYLQLAVTEIRDYGASSTQVCRRLRALLDGLLATVPPDRRPAVRDELCRLDAAVEAAFPDPAARARASGSDRQGIGGRAGS